MTDQLSVSISVDKASLERASRAVEAALAKPVETQIAVTKPSLESLRKRIEATLAKPVDVELRESRESVARLSRAVQTAVGSAVVEVTADTAPAAAEIQTLSSSTAEVKVTADTSAMAAEIAAVTASADASVNVDVSDASIAGARTKVETALAGIKSHVITDVNDASLAASAAKIRGALGGAVGTAFKVGGAAALGVAGAGGVLSAFGAKAAGDYEQLQIAFTGLLGSSGAAEEFLKKMEAFAATTPFQFDEVIGASKKFLALGQSGDEALTSLRTIGDVAASLGVDATGIDRVVLALGQIQSKGKLSTEELNQIGEAFTGFPVFQGLAKELGISTAQLFDSLQKGSIDGETGFNGLLKAFANFGPAAGAMERQSQTLNGRLSTVIDGIKIKFREAFQVGPLKDSLESATPALVALAGKLAEFGSKFAGQFLAGFGQLLDGIKDIDFAAAGEAIGKLTRALLAAAPTLIELGVKVLPPIAAGLDALGPAGIIALGVFGVLGKVGLLVPILSTVGSALKIFAGLVFSLFEANPVVLAITAVIAALTLLYFHVRPFRDFIDSIIDVFTDQLWPAIKLIVDAFGALFSGDFSKAGELFGRALQGIGEAFGRLQEIVLSGLGDLGGWILDGLQIAAVYVIENAPGWLAAAFGWLADVGLWLLGRLGDLGLLLGGWLVDGLTYLATNAPGWIASALGWVVQLPFKILGLLVDFGAQLLEWAVSAFLWVAQNGPAILETIAAWVVSIPGTIMGWLGDLGVLLVGWLTGAWNWVVANGPTIIFGIVTWFSELPDKLLNGLISLNTKLFSFAEGAAKSFWDGFLSVFSGANDIARRVVNAVIRFINENVIDEFNNALDFEIFGQQIDVPDIPRIPQLADGGLITAPTLAIVGEAGPELVLPLNQPDRVAELLGSLPAGSLPAAGPAEPATLLAGLETVGAEIAAWWAALPALMSETAKPAWDAFTVDMFTRFNALAVMFGSTADRIVESADALVIRMSARWIGLVSSAQTAAGQITAAFVGMSNAVNATVSGLTANVTGIVQTYARSLASALNPILSAVGAQPIVLQFAKGGIVENHQAEIAPAGAWRVWAEPETGGEAYIPLARSKRSRSRQIAAETVARLGGNVSWHADGAIIGNTTGIDSRFMARMNAWVNAVGQTFRVVSGYRSLAEQERLYRRWLARVPGQAPAAPPGRSMHNFGLAIDGSHWGRFNPGAFGLRYPMSYEPWHVEPVEAKTWKAGGRQLSGAIGDAAHDSPIFGPLPIPPMVGDGGIRQTAERAMRAVYEKALKWAGSVSLPSVAGPIDTSFVDGVSSPAAARAWAQQAIKLVEEYNHIDLDDARWLAGVLTIARRESSFNPRAINNWDSNARRGTPSKGIMQTIDPTFNAFKIPGLGDIWNPVHNMVAAIRYILRRYGDISRVQQANPNAPAKGYRMGGIADPGTFAVLGEAGSPEVVLPLHPGMKERRFELLRQAGLLAPNTTSTTATTHVNVTQNITGVSQPTTTADAAAAKLRRVAKVLR